MHLRIAEGRAGEFYDDVIVDHNLLVGINDIADCLFAAVFAEKMADGFALAASFAEETQYSWNVLIVEHSRLLDV